MGEEKTSDLEGRRKALMDEKAEGFGRILRDERRRRAEEEMEDAMIDRARNGERCTDHHCVPILLPSVPSFADPKIQTRYPTHGFGFF